MAQKEYVSATSVTATMPARASVLVGARVRHCTNVDEGTNVARTTGTEDTGSRISYIRISYTRISYTRICYISHTP